MALYLAMRDPRVPWYARVWVAVVIAYALSPIDLVPDFIPVFGQLDDLLLVPAGILLGLRMIPAEVMEDCRARVREQTVRGMQVGSATSAVVVATWLLLAGMAFFVVWKLVL